MTKAKRGRAKFYCHTCGRVGWRNPADAQAKAAEVGKTAYMCLAGDGWHVK